MEEEKTVTISKLTIWKSAVAILAIALIISVFTGGFGIKGSTGAAVNTQNAGTTQQQGVVDLSTITGNPDLFPAVGPNNAKNTVVEFADFQCPYCAMAAGLSPQAQQYSSQVPYFGIATQLEQQAQQGSLKFVYVTMNFLDNPTSTNGTESTYAAEAAFCANDQGQFWAMHDAIFKANDLNEDDGKYTKAKLEILAQGIQGLDQAKFKTCLESDADLSKVQQSASTASQFVQGTPTFYVNGQQVQASTTVIQAALK